MAARIPSQLLTIVLLRESVSDPREAFKTPDSITRHTVGKGRAKIGDLYVSRSRVQTPRWAKLFSDWLDIDALGLRIASASAVLLIQRGGRRFGVCFGQGRHLLEPSSIEENFGLLTALNTIDPARVRTIDRKRFDSISRLTREQASHEVPILNFGLELEQDMIRTITGVPLEAGLGKRLSGRDSLSAVVPADLKQLPTLLDGYLRRSRARTYRDSFPGIDSIREVREEALLRRLEDALLEKLKRRDMSRLWLVIPDLLDWADIEGFTYSRAEKSDVLPDIDAASFLDTVRDVDTLSIPYLRRRQVFYLSASDSSVLGEWSALKCIYAEIDDKAGTFLLDSGKWYRIDTGLVGQVDREVRRIPSTALSLPDYKHGETEEEYNRRLAGADPQEYLLMDRKNIVYGGGRSRVEFCDVYTRSRVMVHVKRYGGSSVLSHLFSQGIQSATLLLWDASFRRALNTKLPVRHKLANPEQRPRASDFEVAYAVASQSADRLQLPFFSRVTLRNAFRQLSAFGFKVTCSKIRVR